MNAFFSNAQPRLFCRKSLCLATVTGVVLLVAISGASSVAQQCFTDTTKNYCSGSAAHPCPSTTCLPPDFATLVAYPDAESVKTIQAGTQWARCRNNTGYENASCKEQKTTCATFFIYESPDCLDGTQLDFLIKEACATYLSTDCDLIQP